MNYNSIYYLIKEALDNVFSEAEDKLINSQSIKFKNNQKRLSLIARVTSIYERTPSI